MPQRVRADLLGDPGATGHPPDDPGGTVPVQPPPVVSEEQRPFGAVADRQLDRPGGTRGKRDGNDLAALRVMTKVRWPRSRPRCSMSALSTAREF
jgi:hypothetical protein